MFLFEDKGSQNITQDEKNASLTNAIDNGLYPIVSNILKEVTLNHFGKGDNDTAVAILFAVMATESRCDPNRDNPGGAKGLMQLTPICVKELINLGQSISYENMTIEDNIKGGIVYLNYLSNRILKDPIVKTYWKNGNYLNNISLMMSCYNNGFGAIKKMIKAKKFDQAKAKYYNDIKGFYNFWSAGDTLKKAKNVKKSPTDAAASPIKKEVYVKNNQLISEQLLRSFIQQILIKSHH